MTTELPLYDLVSTSTMSDDIFHALSSSSVSSAMSSTLSKKKNDPTTSTTVIEKPIQKRVGPSSTTAISGASKHSGISKHHGKKHRRGHADIDADPDAEESADIDSYGLAPDVRPVKMSRFRRPLRDYIDSDKVDIHLETFMDRKVAIEDLTPAKLYVYLNQLEEKWILEKSDAETIREHAYVLWGLNPHILPNPMIIFKQYKLNIFQTMRLYMQFVRFDMVGAADDDSMTTTRVFARIFEVISTMYDFLMSEHRLRVLYSPESHAEIPPEISLFRFSFHDFSKNNSFQNLLIFLLRRAFELGYRRYQDQCYEQIYTPEMHPTHAWKPVFPLQRFVYKMIDKNTNYEQWCNLTSSRDSVRSVLSYLSNSEDPEFPLLSPDRHLFAFRNGLYFAKQNTFYPYDTAPQSADKVAVKYFDAYFDYQEYFSENTDWYDIPTPHFQSILDYQKWPEEVCRIWYAMMGRCIYNVGEMDGWQVLPFIKGPANCGKSTMGKITANFYNAQDVGIMSNNIETKFGLVNIFTKLIFMCYEVKENFRVDQADLQCIISGEDMYLAVKNKDPVMGLWKVPGMLFGNESARWVDAAGSMSRRLLTFECKYTVKEVNPLLSKLISQEMAAIIYKANTAYLDLAQDFGNKNIWDILPEQFKHAQAAMARSISPLRAFIETSDSLVIHEEHYMPFQEFWTMHNDFVRERHYKAPQITPDYYSTVFEQYGITIMKQEDREWQGKHVVRDWIVGVGPRDQFVGSSSSSSEGMGTYGAYPSQTSYPSQQQIQESQQQSQHPSQSSQYPSQASQTIEPISLQRMSEIWE